jgi:hypothetical protein
MIKMEAPIAIVIAIDGTNHIHTRQTCKTMKEYQRVTDEFCLGWGYKVDDWADVSGIRVAVLRPAKE